MWLAAALWLSACETVPPPAAPPPPPPLPTMPVFPWATATPAQVRGELVRWFRAAGYQEFQIAALAEHARIESGFRPCASGAAGLRYIYQWGGTRREHLYAFAGARTCPPLETQLAFANDELRNDPKFACFWDATTAHAALAALRRGFGLGNCDVVVVHRSHRRRLPARRS